MQLHWINLGRIEDFRLIGSWNDLIFYFEFLSSVGITSSIGAREIKGK
jgi:hypothetical protein